MSTDVSWVAILGATSGVSAILLSLFIWIFNNVRKPRLLMSQPYVRDWSISGGNITKTWKFVNFEVTSKRGLALGCEAKAIVSEHPNNVQLIGELIKEGYGLHWADIPYSGRSTGVDRVDIGSTPQRLDVVFTVSTQTGRSNLAMPIALSTMWNSDKSVPQAILPAGEYVLKIKVSCANGKGDSKTIKLISPNNSQDLNAEEV
jgi:hypothetical protein